MNGLVEPVGCRDGCQLNPGWRARGSNFGEHPESSMFPDCFCNSSGRSRRAGKISVE